MQPIESICDLDEKRVLRSERVSGLEWLLARKCVGRALRVFVRPVNTAVDELDVCAAYRQWAPRYAAETTTSFLDDQLARETLQGLPQARLLDAGCGVGRRIRDIPGATGIDLSPEMLAAGGLHTVVAGDIREMPFADGKFDMVWCRLVLGHLRDPLPAYQEFRRVCRPGGYVFVTDFHPDAARAGHRRTFNGQDDVAHEIEHYVHRNHAELGSKAGFELIARRDGAVGPSVRTFYIQGLGRRAYIRDFGLKIVAAYLFRRPADR
jgi:malonyl-CoA O-methyltransferase